MQIVYRATGTAHGPERRQALAQVARSVRPVEFATVQASGRCDLSDRVGALLSASHQASDLGASLGHRRRTLFPQLFRCGIGGRNRLQDKDELATEGQLIGASAPHQLRQRATDHFLVNLGELAADGSATLAAGHGGKVGECLRNS